MTLIDTSVWIEALRVHGQQEVREAVSELVRKGDAAWCPVIRLELWSGVGDARERKILHGFSEILGDLDATDQVWDLAIHLGSVGRRKGYTFPIPDLLIFATSRIHGATLFHRDNHFETLKSLSPA